MENKRSIILVTGGEGVAASYVKKVFANYEIILASKKEFDVTSLRSCRAKIKEINPDIILHFAALTDVDYCEKDRILAEKVNIKGTKNMVSVCSSRNIVLVFLSTASVFDGKNPSGYSEKSLPNPVNYYSETKLIAENYIKSNLKKYIIVRAGWLIGGGVKDRKFISYITSQIKNELSLAIVNDKFGTITYSLDLMFLLKKLIENKRYGLFHFGSKDSCSRFEIARYIVKKMNKKLLINPVDSSFFAKKFNATRPTYEIIRSIKINSGVSWKSAIDRYLREDYWKKSPHP